MALGVALSNALTGLVATQRQLAATSDNVANANNDKYNRRQVVVENFEYGGVRSHMVLRAEDKGLVRLLTRSNSNLGYTEQRADLIEKVERALGVLTNEGPLAAEFNDLIDAWRAYEAAPEVSANERHIVRAAETFASEMKRIDIALGELENSIEDEIASKLEQLSLDLNEVQHLNTKIFQLSHAGQPVAALQNDRDARILAISKLVEIQTYSIDEYQIGISTTTGMTLVAGTSVASLKYNNATQELHRSDISGENVKHLFTRGELHSLFDVVDKSRSKVNNADFTFGTLQKIRNQLDDMAFAMSDDSTAISTGATILDADHFIGDTLTQNIANFNKGDTLIIQVNNGTTRTFTATDTRPPAANEFRTKQELLDLINDSNVPELQARINGKGQLQIFTNQGEMGITGTAAAALGFPLPTSYSSTAVSSATGANPPANFNLIAAGGSIQGDTIEINLSDGTKETYIFQGSSGSLTGSGKDFRTPAELLTALNTSANIEASFNAQNQLVIKSKNDNIRVASFGGAFGGDLSFSSAKPALEAIASQTGGVIINQSNNLFNDFNLQNAADRVLSIDVTDNNGVTTTISNNLFSSSTPNPYTAQQLVDSLNGDSRYSNAGIRFSLNNGRFNISSNLGNALEINNSKLSQAFGLIAGNVSFQPPQSFMRAYNTSRTRTGESASNIFESSSGETPSTIDRRTIRVNASLADGTSSLKRASATAVVAALDSDYRNFSSPGLEQTTSSYIDMVNGFLGQAVESSADLQSSLQVRTTLHSEIYTDLRNKVGVNIDTEMAFLSVLQNSYGANARVISTIQNLFDQLLSIA